VGKPQLLEVKQQFSPMVTSAQKATTRTVRQQAIEQTIEQKDLSGDLKATVTETMPGSAYGRQIGKLTNWLLAVTATAYKCRDLSLV